MSGLAAQPAHHDKGFVQTYLWSTDHKVIAMQYLFTGMLMALIGGFAVARATRIRPLGGAVLAVGGASFNDWAGLAAEGQAGSGSRITALAKIMTDIGFDGLDVDYETDGDVARYANVTKAMRKAVDQARTHFEKSPR